MSRFAPVRSSAEDILTEHERWMREHEAHSAVERAKALARGKAEAAARELAEHRRRLFMAAAQLEQAERRLVPDKYSVSQTDLHALDDIHTKERCPSCGLWRPKRVRCSHCARQPNRMQAKLAQAKQIAEEMASGKEYAMRNPVGLGRIVMADYRSTSSPAEPHVHTKEKCEGCGVWKRRGGPCRLCETRPNRAQARRAQAKPRPRAEFYRVVELAPSQQRLLARERAQRAASMSSSGRLGVTRSSSSFASWQSTGEGVTRGADAAVAPDAPGEESDGVSVGASRTSLGTKAGSSTSRLLSRPMSAPSLHALVVPPTEDELGVPGSVSRRVVSSPRGYAGHGVLLELMDYAATLKRGRQ